MRRTVRRSVPKTAAVAVLVIAILLAFVACDKAPTGEYFDVLGTTLYIESTIDGYAEAVAEEMRGQEALLSAAFSDSDIGRINAAGAGESVTVSELTMTLLVLAREVYELTDGAYDPSVYPLVRLWGFAPGEFVQGVPPKHIPTDEEVRETLSLVGFERAFALNAEKRTVTKLIEGAELDLGGIAKGYAVQKALESASGTALVNLGGNIGGVGRTFTVGIGAPRQYPVSYVGTVKLYERECISTSGDYERWYEADGVRRHHVIDPRTGYPSERGLASATVICLDGALGDALATAIMVAGEEKGREWLAALSSEHEGISAVFVTPNLEVTAYGREFTKA